MNSQDPRQIERRQFLRTASAVGFGSFLTGELASASPASAAPALEPLVLSSSCVLTASQVEGPFYFDAGLVRRDITEGRPGIVLELLLKVVRFSDCTPIAGAVVDVWHTHHRGRYSGYASEGTAGLTFMRGIQITSSEGIARFRTIVPGWYAGRTAHIHIKINPDETTELTSQLYFQPELTQSLYLLPPYNVRGPSPTTNATDPIFDPDLVMLTRKLSTAVLGPVSTALHVPQLIAGKTIVVVEP